MAVTFDSDATNTTDAGPATSFTNTLLTVGSGTNRVLLALVCWDTSTPGTVTAAWDVVGANQAMTLIVAVNGSSTNRVELWGLVAPVSGNKTLTVTSTNSNHCCLSAIAFAGANQTGGATSFPNSTSATASTANPSLVITSATGNFTVALMGAAGAFDSGRTQTVLRGYPVNAVASENCDATQATGAASVTHGFTQTATAWGAVGTDIAVPGVVAPSIINPFRALMG
jgi:hypothetical protein